MVRSMSLLIGIAALGAIATAADARDGCGRGLYYNGYRCVPEPYYYGPPDRYYAPPQRFYGPPVERAPSFQFDFGGGDDGRRYSPPSSRWGTRNGCPPRYTVQDGLCKPYTGR
jgi:hypothetical protein